nr:hypothetical protein [Tanacetum cinerariifolium]
IIMANVPPNDPNVDAPAIVHAPVNPDHAPAQPATKSAPKKGVTNMDNTSQLASMLKKIGYSSKKDNLSVFNSFSALNDAEEDDEEDVQNMYDKSDNLLQNTKAGGSSSFMANAEEDAEEEEEDPEEDPKEDSKEEPEDDDDDMEMDDEAKVIDPYMDDGTNNPLPPNSEEEETPPTSPVIPDADGQSIPPIASFGQNFHFGESSSTANLLTGNSKIVPTDPMCPNLGTAWKRLGKMEKLMSERIDTEGRIK